MKSIVLHRYVLFILFTTLYSGVAPELQSHKYHNSISKVFFHQGMLGDKVVCYCTAEPICNRWPSKDPQKDQAHEELVFFMPNTSITPEALDALKRMQNIQRPFYRISFESVSKPMPGVKVLLSYNTRKIGYEFEQFNPISAPSGIVFHLYNKDVLKDIKGKTDPLLRTASRRSKPTIMVDCGHGGDDYGSTVASHITEKEVNLAIGKQVADFLRSNGCSVLLTRDRDITVPVDERTTFANRSKIDLFVSIHANSARASISGIETYWSGRHLFRKQDGNLDAITQQAIGIFSDYKDKASQELASFLHTHSLESARSLHSPIDRKVRESVAQVLLGSEVPGCLIEVGFLSHEKEGLLLAQPEYQKLLAQGITKGITSYLKSRKLL